MKPTKITTEAELAAVKAMLKTVHGYAYLGVHANQLHGGGVQIAQGEFGDDVLCIPVATCSDVGTLVALTANGARRWAIGYVTTHARQQRAIAYLHAWAVVSGGGIGNSTWSVRRPVADMLERVCGLDSAHRVSCDNGDPFGESRWSLTSQGQKDDTFRKCPTFPRALLPQLREIAGMPFRKANGGHDEAKIVARFERAKQLLPDLSTVDPTPATFAELSDALGCDVVPYLTPARAAKEAVAYCSYEYGIDIVVTEEEMTEEPPLLRDA